MFPKSVGILVICLIAAIVSSSSALDSPTAPYMVQIKTNPGYSSVCGGALVGPNHVLTAASCIAGYTLDLISVVGGITNSAEQGVERKVAQVITANDNEEPSLDRDVAILKLASPMEGKHIETVPMATVAPKMGDIMEFPGWTAQYEGSQMVTTPKRVVKMPIISREECKRKYGSYLTEITRSMMCAYEAVQHEEDCYSPSGSPVMYNGQVSGIVSWGETCGYGAYPALMANVAELRDFIEKSIKV